MSESSAPPTEVGPDAVFGALGDASRRRILRTVGQRPAVTASQLAEGLPISRQAVVKHLQVLAAAGLVRAQRVGREQRYHPVAGTLDTAVAWMIDTGAAWDDRLERLRRDVGRLRHGDGALDPGQQP